MANRGGSLPAALALLAWSAPSSAGGVEPSVGLHAEGCGAADEQEMRRFVALELGGEVTGDAGGRTGVRALVACVGDAAEIVITDRVTAKTAFRRVALHDVEATLHTRVAAMAVVELVAASWLELATPDPSPVPAWRPPPGPERTAALATALEQATGTPPRRAGPALNVSGHVLGPLRGLGVVGGGALGIAREPADSGFIGGVEVGAATGSGETPSGTVAATLGAIGVELGERWRWSRLFYLDTTLGFRGGWAWLEGMPKDERVWSGRTSGLWTGGVARVGVGVAWRPLSPSLSLELGHVLRPVRGLVDGAGEIGMAGSWIGLKLKLTWKGKGWAPW